MDRETKLKCMGIEVWVPRGEPVARLAPSIDEATVATESPDQDQAWQTLEASVAKCVRCSLSKTRTQTVFGSGDRHASLMFIGEAPGADEDKQGKPFVGRAGMLLTEMIRAIGLTREQVFIANILKCRPPNNRDPMPQEVRSCTPYLQQQIHFIQPKLMVALGRIAAHFLLESQAPLGQLRGKIHRYGDLDTPLLVTYHPAYLLRAPAQKAKSYQDMHTILQWLTEH